MSNNVKITYVNRSMNQDLPKIFLFIKNEIPTFDALKDGVAWRVIEDVGRGSSCKLNFPIETAVSVSRSDRTSQTAMPADKQMMRKKAVSYNQEASFVPHPKLYWVLASEIQEGQQLSSAGLNSDSFFEQDLEGVSEVTVGLYGNDQDGYRFVIESQK